MNKSFDLGWESHGKKHPYYGKSMSPNFPGPPQFSIYEKCDEANHRMMEIRWEKSTHTMGKV